MRVVGGFYKGRVLNTFKDIGVRPTSDMARESLFNILQKKVIGARFLDLFCGTGALGIEALSRGAKESYFIDLSKESINLTKKNIDKCKIENAKVIQADAISFLDNTEEKFDIIYIDPPYKSDLGIKALNKIKNVLSEDGICVFETDLINNEQIDGLELYDLRRYGRAFLSFYKIKKINKVCVFAGSFDPISVGHENIINKCLKDYDKVIVVIGENKDKTPIFPLDIRKKAIENAFSDKVKVVLYEDYKDDYINFLKNEGVNYYARGIRNEEDLKYEKSYEEINNKLYPFVKTVYYNCEKEYKNVSSTLIKDLILNKKDFSSFVPKNSYKTLKEYLEKNNKD